MVVLGALLVACSGDDKPQDVTPTSQAVVPSTIPPGLSTVPLQGEVPTAEPNWDDGDSAVGYSVRVLLYAQGLAERANMEMPSDPLRYAVSELETVVSCQDEPDGGFTIMGSLGVRWCPIAWNLCYDAG